MIKRILSRLLFVFGAAVLGGCSTTAIPEDHKQPSYKLVAPQDSPLFHFLQSELAGHYNQTGVLPITSGVDAFAARLEAVKAAKQSIDLQYYIYHDDETGKLLAWELIEAADRGVRVRALLDDFTLTQSDERLSQLASHPNIEIRLFNPAYERDLGNISMLWDFARLNHRMHNKSLTVDNLLTIVGGRNIGNEYFSKHQEVEFGDFDLLAIGEAVDKVSTQFDLYWNSSQVREIQGVVGGDKHTDYLESYRKIYTQVADRKRAFADDEYLQRLAFSDLVKQLKANSFEWYWGEAQVVFDPPEKAIENHDKHWLLTDIKGFLSQADKQIFISSPYFIPTRNGVKILSDAVKRGVKVTVLTNSLAATDVLAVHAGYQKYRRQLIENGVHIYEYKPDPNMRKRSFSWQGSSRSSLHAKTFVLDDMAVFVGSFNFDPRSVQLNTEMGMLFKDNAFAKEVLSRFQTQIHGYSYRVVLEGDDLVWIDEKQGKRFYAEPNAGGWYRFMADFISLFPIESQL